MLNLLLKTRQNADAVNTREWSLAPKTCTLATASWGGCKACHLHAAPSKRRSNLPLQRAFQLVESVWNHFCQAAYWTITTFCHKQMEPSFRFYRIFVKELRAWTDAFLILKHGENRYFSICRSIKSQDDFHVISMRLANLLCVINVFVKPNKQHWACSNIVMARKRPFRGTGKNIFVKPNEQRWACSNIVMARKRTFRGTGKECFLG